MHLIHFLKMHRMAATPKWLRSAGWKGLTLPIRPGTKAWQRRDEKKKPLPQTPSKRYESCDSWSRTLTSTRANRREEVTQSVFFSTEKQNIYLSKPSVCFKLSCFSQALKKESDDLTFLAISFIPRLILFLVPLTLSDVTESGCICVCEASGVIKYKAL